MLWVGAVAALAGNNDWRVQHFWAYVNEGCGNQNTSTEAVTKILGNGTGC